MSERETDKGNGKLSAHGRVGDLGRADVGRAAGNGENAPPPDAFGNSGPVALPPPAPEAFGDPRRQRPTNERARDRKKEQDREQDQERDEDQDDDKKDQKGEPKQGDDQRDEKKEDQKPKKPPFYKRPVLMSVLVAIVLVLGVGALLFWLHYRQFESTDDAFIDGNVVTISPNVSATVLQVLVNDNWPVKRGQVMVQLDPRDYLAVVKQREADLLSAQGQLEQARAMVDVDQANLDEARAGVEVAEANAANALADFHRITALSPEARSQQQLDLVTANEKSTYAQVDQAKSKVEAAQATVADALRNVATAEAQVKVAQASLDTANLNLGYCTIIAPEDGRVTRKSVQPGSYVSVGTALMSVVPTDVWVTANFKETQLADIRPGQSVSVHVDAYPDKDLQAKVDSIQNGSGSQFSLLPPENATGNYVKVVQRVPVKIVFVDGQLENYPHLLAPGLSVEPSVHVAE